MEVIYQILVFNSYRYETYNNNIMKSSSPLNLKEKWKEFIVIDSNLNQFRIESITQVQSFSFHKKKFKCTYKFIKKMTIDEVKNYIINCLKEEPKNNQTGENIDDLIKDLKKCDTFLQVLLLL